MNSTGYHWLFPESRIDWFGLGVASENKTGAFIAVCILASWCFAHMRFRGAFTVSLLLSSFFAIFLIQTESRGGLLATCMGLLCLLCFYIKNDRPNIRDFFRLHTRKLISAVSVVALLTFYSNHLGLSERFAHAASGQDESSNVRLRLYAAGLQMMVDAPQGWGAGQAGDAYGQWYQAIGDSREYLSLVNSHLTWMADYGLLFQIFYIGTWGFVFILLYPRSRSFFQCNCIFDLDCIVYGCCL